MADPPKTRVTASPIPNALPRAVPTRRTGMSFQRTRMSADRTLMSVIRTSLSLIGFGFTIFQVFQKAHEAGMLKSGDAAHNFGIALVLLGVAVLMAGIGYHVSFMYGLRKEREQLKADGLVHAESHFPLSLTLMTALLLLAIVIGVLAIQIPLKELLQGLLKGLL